MSDPRSPARPFVRDTMLAPQHPPLAETGVVKWLHEKLFAGPLNTGLTILGIAAVYLVAQSILPWLMRGVWNASSQQECYRIIAERHGAGATGACWALIRDRWHQFLFGFYPREFYWRPLLALALLIAALAPALYWGNRRASQIMVGLVGAALVLALWGVRTDGLHVLYAAVLMAALFAVASMAPKRLIWLTVAFPFLGFWLLWGGTIWGPVGAATGFVILALVFRASQARLGPVVGAGAGIVAAAVWWLVVQSTVTGALQTAMPFGLVHVESDVFGGFLLSFVIGVKAISASLPMGILLALGRRSDMLLIKTLSVGFIEFIRGVPLITMLFTASLLLQYFLPPQTQFDLILRVIILVTLFAAAYIAEVIRGGLAALPRGQYEAADALGLDYWQAQRLIVMPQALKIAIPGIVSSFIGLFKDTTLVALVGLADPLTGIRKIVLADINWKGIYWEPFIFVAIIFFVINFGMSRYSMYLERRLKTDHR